MAETYLDIFDAARRISTPLMSIRTADIGSTVKQIQKRPDSDSVPIVAWDNVKGPFPINEPAGQEAIKVLLRIMIPKLSPDQALARTQQRDAIKAMAAPMIMLQMAPYLPEGTILFMLNLDRYLEKPEVVQAIWNLRDIYKMNNRTLVIPCPDIQLPPLLSTDVLVLDEPLPDAEFMKAVVLDTYKTAQSQGNPVKNPTPEIVEHAKDALLGLPAFPAEQVCSRSLRLDGMDLDQLWEFKRQQVEQTPGLKIHRGGMRFHEIVGLQNTKNYHLLRGAGPDRRLGVVFIDEIDKHVANFGASGTGDTTAEMVGALLTWMQDIEAEGSLFFGVQGTGKTLLGRAIAAEWGVPLINYDLSGMKASHVGESGRQIRAANKVVSAVTQNRPYIVATCNKMENLPLELRRRFTSATFFFDLSTRPEKDAAWDYYEKKWKVGPASKKRPSDPGWTPAEIRNCCYNAHVLNVPTEQAAKYIVPIAQSGKEQIEAMRRAAHENYISASYEGVYSAPDGVTEPDPVMIAVAVIPQGKRSMKITGSGKPN